MKKRSDSASDSAAALIGCVIGLIISIGLGAFSAWMFEILWNWLMPLLFHLPTLTFWQAWGIIALLSIIGGFFKSSTDKTK